MLRETEVARFSLLRMIAKGGFTIAGHRGAKIYGRFDCRSGKKMKRENRVFFKDEINAQKSGFRPCGHCMKDEYKRWISLQV